MLKAISVSDKIWWVGVNDRKTPLFENLWSLPYGVSYNSYLIDDEKVALIDGVKGEFFGEYLERIQSIVGARPVDYLIVNHVEPDHSSAIRMLRQVYPNITVVADKQALTLIGQFYGTSLATKEVKDGETLELGAHSLTFATIPMVHWPETMISFENSSGIAFTCDAFGSYGALNGGIFGDELDMHVYTSEARRYYATIVGRFSVNVQAALKKAAALPIKMICPSHGPVHRGEGVARAVKLYDGMSRQETTQSAVIVYGSMYGNTARMAECVADGLCRGGVADVKVYDAGTADLSWIIRDAWRSRGLALLSCCYNMGMFPAMMPVVEKIDNCKISGRVLAIAGCYSWSKGAELKPLQALADKPGWDLIENVVEVKSCPTEADEAALRGVGAEMARRIRAE
ncbi:FprA family A-type flavoprotein [Pyramidobacter sp. SM-530-WT-4B]|uniref:FprA family A-type flavoprotein n=1 Tax=Pyramidobacter porci TaxID=2605789 RepID=A0A6L5Y9N7_9BACT|nr:FprA family A-type flavoprotein [Pyramidobacter porci]MCI6259636.1 FprA family A-type flavoprotein [Pyramidobacter sp.]MDY2648617.1 FprA family A-type flavoprotein [Pyramidobacter porci]MST55009.1 FprA family A-type flavoprotein [Pyramidobacter porci]